MDGFKKSQRYWVKELSLYNRIEAFSKIFTESGTECIAWGSIQVLPNQVNKKSFFTFEDVDLWGSYAKLRKNRVKLWELILTLEISIYCLPRSFNGFLLYVAQSSFTEIKSAFTNLQNELLPKAIGQELLVVNNSV